jgi:ABC-type sulfate/molybdate transport systems ATPase subunit
MELLFGIKSYIPLKFSSYQNFKDPQDLMKQCLDFIQSDKEGDQALVLLGNSGAGKSLYLV